MAEEEAAVGRRYRCLRLAREEPRRLRRSARLDADWTLEAKGIDTDGRVAVTVRANGRGPIGSAPAMEPSPGSQDDRPVEADAAGGQRLAQQDAATTSTWAMPKAPTAGALEEAARATIKALPRFVTGVGAFALSMMIPGNFQGETVDVEDGVRITLPPGQRYVYAERRVDDGLLGSGIGARWEKLPIPMEVVEGPRGRFLRFDLDYIARVVGTPQEADRLLDELGALMARPPRKSGSDATDQGKSATSRSPNPLPPPRPPSDICLLRRAGATTIPRPIASRLRWVFHSTPGWVRPQQALATIRAMTTFARATLVNLI